MPLLRDRLISEGFGSPESSSTGMRTDIIYDYSKVIEVDHEVGKREVDT